MANSKLDSTRVDITMDGEKVEEVDNFKYLGATTIQGWHLNSGSAHQNCHSNSNDGQTVQNMEEQHQLPNQIQALQVTGCLHTPVWLRGLDSPGRHRKANSGLRIQMSEKATEDLVPGPQNQ